MNYFSDREKKYHYRQSGVATLVVSVGVALLMAVAAVGMMRSGLLEQKIAANDLRMREAQEIAERGMARVISSSSLPSSVKECPSPNSLGFMDLSEENFNSPHSSNVSGLTTNEEYKNLVKLCYKPLGGSKIYFVRSQAEIPSPKPDKEPVVKAFVESWFASNTSYLKNSFDKTLFFTKGDFCPVSNKGGGKNNQKNSCRVNIGNVETWVWAVATGVANVDDLPKNNTKIPEDAGISYKDIGNVNTAWEYAFDVTLAEAKDLARKDPGKPFYYFPDGGLNNSDKNFTSSSKNPVVVIFDSDGSKNNCPKINGNIEIHGVVYINDPNNLCDEIGLGNMKLYGSMISDGDVNRLNSNLTFNKFEGDLSSVLKSDKSFIIPGTWRDFKPEPQP